MPGAGCHNHRLFGAGLDMGSLEMKSGQRSSRFWVLALACVMLGAASEWRRATAIGEARTPLLAVLPAGAAPASPPRLTPRATGLIPMPDGVPSAHASALTVLPSGELLAFWWAGARESAPDVSLYLSRYADGRWSAARKVADRGSLGRELGFAVRRIGNPSVWTAPDGRVHVFLVATGLGGWAAARVLQLVSTDAARSFHVRRMLPLTPLANTSVLVRTNPVGLDDGGWLLPAYFELRNKYPLIVSFDADGGPRWISRIGRSTTALQPALLPVSGTELRALMRDIGPSHRVQQAVSHDAGRHWDELPPLDVPNRDDSVAALRLAQGGYVMLHNDTLPGGSPRQWLRLSTSADAEHWTPALDVERGVPGDEFSYPSVQQLGRQLHVTYTAQRKAIGHQVYDIEDGAGGAK